MKVRLCKRFAFEAAHFLPSVGETHRCRRLHGHSFRFEVEVSGEVDAKTGWLLDYGELSARVRPVVDLLDHTLLNAVPGLENPTAELLSAWIWAKLEPGIPGLSRVTVLETCTTRCDYLGPGGQSSG